MVPSDMVATLVSEADARYYVDDPTESADACRDGLERLGRSLYQLLDTSQGLLTSFLSARAGNWDLIVIAMEVSEGIAHLPWELLHDGESFLIAADNPVVPVRVVQQASVRAESQPRALRMLFMACAPERMHPLLDYEAEEAAIDQVATKESLPLLLIDEPTGNLRELELRLARYADRFFDVIHITGHATRNGDSSRFITETTAGEAHLTTTREIRQALLGAHPRVLFLSGCRTAEPGDLGAAPSMAEELARTSAPTVIGWGRPISDDAATQATAEFYRQLMRGRSPAWALAAGYRLLLEGGQSRWHCLRMFTQGEPTHPLVTAPENVKEDDTASIDRAKERTAYGLAKVDIGEFVGRRRATQELLRYLDPRLNSDRLGAIVHGIGGIGKTTLVSRVLGMLPRDTPYIPVNTMLTRESLLEAMRLQHQLFANVLGGAASDEHLAALLVRALNKSSRGAIFVLDEFERNQRESGRQPRLVPEAAQTLTALISALSQAPGRHRVVITCRYRPDVAGVDQLADMSLEPLDEFHRRRKIARLRRTGQVDNTTIEMIRGLAKDNTRLLETLFALAQANPALGSDFLRRRMANQRQLFYDEDLDVTDLVSRFDPADVAVLRAVAPFRVPVDAGVLARLVGPPALSTVAEIPAGARRNVEERAARLARWHLLDPIETAGVVSYQLPAVLESAPALRGSDPAGDMVRCATALAAELRDFDSVNDVDDPDLLNVPALNEVLRLALDGGAKNLAVRAAWTLAGAALIQYRYTEATETCRRVTEVASHPLLHAALGYAHAERGEMATARAHFAVALADLSGRTDKDQARVLCVVAFWDQFYDSEAARRHADQALSLARSAGDAVTEAGSLRCIASGYAGRAEFHTARALYNQALERAESVRGGELTAAVIRMDRADTDIAEGLGQAARIDLAELLAFYERRGMEQHQAAIHLRMSVALQLDDLPAALAAAHRAHSLAADAGWTRGEVGTLINLCIVHVRMISGSPPAADDEHANKAMQYAREARSLADTVGWPQLRKDALQNLVFICRIMRKEDDAAAFETELDQLTTEMAEPPVGKATRLVFAAEIHVQDQRYAEATEAASQALILLGPAITPDIEMRARMVIARIGDEQQASAATLEVHLRRLLELCAVREPSMAPLVHVWTARMFIREERHSLARQHLELSLRGYTAEGDQESVAYLHELYATISDISPHERVSHLRDATRLRLKFHDHAAAATTMQELATAVPGGDKEQILRAALALAESAGANVQQHGILTDLAMVVSQDAERARLQVAATRALRRSQAIFVTVGSRLFNLLYSGKGARYLGELETQRQAVKSSHDITLPPVQTGDDATMDPAAYVVFLWGDQIDAGKVAAATPIANLKERLARPTTAAMINIVAEAAGRPDVGRRITSTDVESPQTVVAREMVSAIVNLALIHRTRLDAPPSARRPLAGQERQLIENAITIAENSLSEHRVPGETRHSSSGEPRDTNDAHNIKLDNGGFKHYVAKELTPNAISAQEPITALCGWRWVPTRSEGTGEDLIDLPTCPRCKAVLDALPDT